MESPHFVAAAILRAWPLVLLVAVSCSAQSNQSDPSASQPRTPSAASVGTQAKLITRDPNPATPVMPSSPIGTQNEDAPYESITNHQRFHWFIKETFGPKHLASGLFMASFETARDNPPEYHGTWAGFGKRFASREAASTIRNGMEAGLGTISGEDPRYFRNAELPLKRRVGNVVKETFLDRRRDGSYNLAYARYTAFTATNFISNTWRPDSQADTQHALSRIGEAFLGRMASNAWDEFWPDAKRHFFHRNN